MNLGLGEGGPFRRLRKRASLRRGERICAEAFCDLHRKISMFADGYAALDPITCRKRVGQIVLSVKSALEIINDKQVLAPLVELHYALILRDAGVTHPILTNELADAEYADHYLRGLAGNRRRRRDELGAFCLATVGKLVEEGVSKETALARVARHADVSVPALKDWQKRLKKDSAPFRPLRLGRHRQRLSFRVRVCRNFAVQDGVSGEQLLKYFRKHPALVRRLSIRLER